MSTFGKQSLGIINDFAERYDSTPEYLDVDGEIWRSVRGLALLVDKAPAWTPVTRASARQRKVIREAKERTGLALYVTGEVSPGGHIAFIESVDGAHLHAVSNLVVGLAINEVWTFEISDIDYDKPRWFCSLVDRGGRVVGVYAFMRI